MSCKITPSRRFMRSVKRLLKHYPSFKDDLEAFKSELSSNPELDSKLGNNLRKVRMSIASKGKGKSGGARVITYTLQFHESNIEVILLDIYDKSERSTMTDKELRELSAECGIL